MDASLLSAYFGLDDAFPSALEPLCPGATGQDGMPVIFSHELDPSTVQAGDFVITNVEGEESKPLCSTFRPAIDGGELRTVLLVGQFGTAALTQVCVVGDIWDKCHRVSFQGQCVQPKPVTGVPAFVLAEEILQNVTCPEGSSERAIRVTWDAGVTLPNATPVTGNASVHYSVTMKDGSVVTPSALVDLEDRDNNHLLCFHDTPTGESSWEATSVSFEAGHLTDPNEDGTNLETTVNVVQFIKCGSPPPVPMEADGSGSGSGSSGGVPSSSGVVPIHVSFSWIWLTGLVLLHMIRHK